MPFFSTFHSTTLHFSEMGKRILAILLGIITAFIVIFLLENVWKVIYPPPAGFNMEDKASWGKLMEAMPVGALFCLIIGYAAGCFTGGWVAARIATDKKMRAALIVGIVL